MSRDRVARALVIAACASVAGLVYLAWTVWPDVYNGAPPSVPTHDVRATCDPSGPARCQPGVVRLNAGRFYVRTAAPVARLTIDVDDDGARRAARVLVVRVNQDVRMQLVDADGASAFTANVPSAHGRWIAQLSEQRPWNRIVLTPAASGAQVIVEELGFFTSDRGLLQSTRQPLPWVDGHRFYRTAAAIFALVACVLVIAAAWVAPMWMRSAGAVLLTVLAAAMGLLELGTMFSPYWSTDIRPMYGSELVLSDFGGNLTSGVFEGLRITQGQGQTIAPRFVVWHRMPGYGWFCAFAAWLSRSANPVDVAATVVVLQVLFYAIAVGVFFHVARDALGVGVAAVVSILVTLLPKQLAYTEADSMVAPLALLVAAALLAHLVDERNGRAARWRTFLLVNGAFALWFAMRNDALVGWLVVAGVLAGRRWVRWLVPVALALSIALPWALYKRQYRHELNLMPTNTGEVFILSLCEVPGPFPYPCTDDGYLQWTRALGFADNTSQAASSRGVAESIRHWLTYPAHFTLMVWSKLRRSVLAESFPGFRTRINGFYRPYGEEAGLFAMLLTVFAVAVAVGHQRRRTLLVGWALLLNMPLFYVVFESSGRFYAAAGVSLIVATIPILLERGFYAAVQRHPWRTATVVACTLLFVSQGHRVEDAIVAHDAWHYWTPLLDPARSSLRFIGH